MRCLLNGRSAREIVGAAKGQRHDCRQPGVIRPPLRQMFAISGAHVLKSLIPNSTDVREDAYKRLTQGIVFGHDAQPPQCIGSPLGLFR